VPGDHRGEADRQVGSIAAADDKVERALAARRENLAAERPEPEE
jgi:hypothetical protein